jgi:hypothetical protein
MKKTIFIFLFPFSFYSYSQRMDPIMMNTNSITAFGGIPIIFNQSPANIGSDALTGIEEISVFETNLIFPNPTTDFLNLKEISEVTIYNQTGILMEKCVSNKMDVSIYPSGVYFVSVNDLSPIKLVKL